MNGLPTRYAGASSLAELDENFWGFGGWFTGSHLAGESRHVPLTCGGWVTVCHVHLRRRVGFRVRCPAGTTVVPKSGAELAELGPRLTLAARLDGGLSAAGEHFRRHAETATSLPAQLRLSTQLLALHLGLGLDPATVDVLGALEAGADLNVEQLRAAAAGILA